MRFAAAALFATVLIAASAPSAFAQHASVYRGRNQTAPHDPATTQVIARLDRADAWAIEGSTLAERVAGAPDIGQVLFVRPQSADDARLSAIVADQVTAPLTGVFSIGNENGSTSYVKPFYRVVRNFTRDGAGGGYVSRILIGLEEVPRTQTHVVRQLPTPIQIQISGADVEPSTVSFTSTALPFPEVVVRTPDIRAVNLLVSPTLDEFSVPFDPTIHVETTSARIEGLGLADAEVNVSVIGVSPGSVRVVRLRVDPEGHLSDSTVELNENGDGVARIRSNGIGQTTIHASANGLPSSSTAITFGFPFLTIGAALLGGALGGGIRFLTTAKKQARRLQLLMAAVFSGVLVFALYAVGVNLLPIQPTVTVGSVVVFALSAVGAYLGPALLNARLPTGGGAGGG